MTSQPGSADISRATALAGEGRASGSARLCVLLVLAAWLLLVITRIAGPSDLYDKEQPRTVAYTADMLVNGHWILPCDTFGIPATKPPLFNWISVPFVQAFGYREWAMKIPSIFASLAVLVFLLIAARRLDRSWELAAITALIWLSAPMTAKLLYVARPDMLLVATLTGAWLAATMMVQSEKPRSSVALLYWICILASMLAKGPSVILALLYLPLAAKLIGGSWGKLRHSGWWWGLPLLLITSALYAWLARQQEPEFFHQVLLGKEVGGHIAGPLQWAKTFFNGPFYLVARFLPWSLLAICMFVRIPIKKWFAHPLGPAILWLLLIVLSMSFVSTKRPDRYAPAFVPVALLAAYCIIDFARKFQRKIISAAAGIAIAIIIGLVINNQFFSDAAKTHYGEHLQEFAKAIHQNAGNDLILFTDGEMTPLETLLGRNQPLSIPDSILAQAKWRVGFYEPNSDAIAISKPLPFLVDKGDAKLALYRLTPPEGISVFHNLPGTFEPAGFGDADRWLQRQHIHNSPSPLPPETQTR